MRVAPAAAPRRAIAEEQWWDIVGSLGPVATLLAASVAALLAWRTLAQRRQADQRSQWWARTQWALDAAMSEDPARREVGLGVLELLASSDLAGDEEVEIISIAWAGPLADRWHVDDDVSFGHNEETSNGSEVER
jgi:hypothetical protein